MYRLLIVDDESMIVDYLTDLFREVAHLDLEVHSVYSAPDAVNFLKKYKTDIVITDIQMPGMTGLELQKYVSLHSPRCKVIFLTGYDEFEYVREAMRYNGVDYLLKTESDDQMILAVEKAIDTLEKELKADHFLRQAEQQLRVAKPLLQKEYLYELLVGNSQAINSRNKQFSELDIPLDARAPVFIMIARIDEWPENRSISDKALLLFAVQNIAADCLSPGVQALSVTYDRSRLLWLIQPKLNSIGDAEENVNDRENLTVRFVSDSLGFIQKMCRELLKLKISIAMSNKLVQWNEAPDQFEALRHLFQRDLGLGRELLLVEEQCNDDASNYTSLHNRLIRKKRSQIDMLGTYLENGQKEAFNKVYAEVMALEDQTNSSAELYKPQIYYALVSIFLHYLNLSGTHSDINKHIDLSKLTRLEEHLSWDSVAEYFFQIAELLFTDKSRKLMEEEDLLIQQIKSYILDHLQGDLSLATIAKKVGFNPSYLSRLYKQKTGEGLSESIMNARLTKAKQLLEQTSCKIHEIAAAVGFEVAPHFYRFFKKATNLTPQEYRESKQRV